MAGAACTSDYECRLNEMCYSGVGWYEEDPTAWRVPDGALRGCLCNTWYAWEGPNCDQYSTGTLLTIAANFGSLMLGVVISTVLLWSLQEYREQRKLSLCTRDSTVVTILLSLVASLGSVFWALVQVCSTALVSGEPLVDYERTRDIYKGRWNILSNFAAPISTFFGGLALMSISLMWVEIAMRSGRLTSLSKSRLRITKLFVYTFMGGAVLLGSTGAIVEKASGRVVMGYFIFPLVVSVITTYLLGAIKIHRIINSSSSMRNEYVLSNASSNTSRPAGSADVTDQNTATADGTADGLETGGVLVVAPGGPRSSGKAVAPVPDRSTVYSTETSSGGSSRPMRNEAFVRILRRIRNTSIVACFALLLFGGSYLALSIVDSVTQWKELTRPSSLSFVKVVHNTLISSSTFSQVVVSGYVYRSVMTSRRAQARRRRRRPAGPSRLQQLWRRLPCTRERQPGQIEL